jgi:hypothetical protein
MKYEICGTCHILEKNINQETLREEAIWEIQMAGEY